MRRGACPLTKRRGACSSTSRGACFWLARGAGLAALAAAGAAQAESLSAGASPCGGDAYSSAQVVEGRPPRRGPLTAVPDTLCADLSAPRGPTTVDIYVAPGLSGGGNGADGAAAPYEDGRSRGSRPTSPPRRGY